MKNLKLGQLLRSAAKNSTLLVVALLSFQTIECQKDSKQRILKRDVAQVAAEEDSYTKTVQVNDLQSGDNVEPSIYEQSKQLEDGSVVQIKTTIEPDVEHGTVKTTVEKWTYWDYAKAAAIGAGLIGAGLAYVYRDDINKQALLNSDWYFDNYYANAPSNPKNFTIIMKDPKAANEEFRRVTRVNLNGGAELGFYQHLGS